MIVAPALQKLKSVVQHDRQSCSLWGCRQKSELRHHQSIVRNHAMKSLSPHWKQGSPQRYPMTLVNYLEKNPRCLLICLHTIIVIVTLGQTNANCAQRDFGEVRRDDDLSPAFNHESINYSIRVSAPQKQIFIIFEWIQHSPLHEEYEWHNPKELEKSTGVRYSLHFFVKQITAQTFIISVLMQP